MRTAVSLVLAGLLASSCAAKMPLPGAAVNFGALQGATTAPTARVAFTVRQAYAVNYLQAVDWDTCVITLTNTAPVVNLSSGNLTPTVTAGARSASFVFGAVTPAPNYSVTVQLSRGGTQIAQGTTTGLTLAPGPNTANVPVAVNNQNVVTLDHTLITGDSLTAGLTTLGSAALGTLARPCFNGTTTGNATLGNYIKISGIDSDNAGSVYVSDASLARIVVIPPSGGTPAVVIGTGSNGYTPDGSVGGGTSVNVPAGLVHEAAPAGRLTFCETGAGTTDGRIRTISAGYLTTLAGGGAGAAGGTNVDAVSVQLNQPVGLCADDAGNMYFTETGLGLVRRITGASRKLATIATPPAAGPTNFGPICLDRIHQVLYYSDGNVIYSLVSPLTSGAAIPNIVATLTATQLGLLTSPPVTVTGLATDGNGLLYAAVASQSTFAFDSDAKTVRIPVGNTGTLVTLPGRSIDVIAGNGNQVTANSNDVTAFKPDATTQILGGTMNNLAIDVHASSATGTLSGTLYFANTFSSATPFSELVQLFPPPQLATHAGTIETAAGSGGLGFAGDGGPASAAKIASPYGAAVDASGNVYIADTYNNRMRKIDLAGNITTLAGTGVAGALGDGGPAASAQLHAPFALAVDAAGAVYIADNGNNEVRKVDANGIISTLAGNGTAGFSGNGGPGTAAQLNYPKGVAVDAAGNVYVSDGFNSVVRKIDRTGTITAFAGTGAQGSSGDGGLAVSAQLNNPAGVAADAAGNVYIVDMANQTVRKVDTSGTITRIAGTIGVQGATGDGGPATSAKFSNPYGVAVDPAGNVYVADVFNSKVREINAAGIISTLAGNGGFGALGDNGAAASAQLGDPYGVAVDPAGNVYIADSGNSRLREVH